MKSFISARFFAVLFFVTLFLVLLSACGRAEPETIRVAVFYDQNSGKNGEMDVTEIYQYLESGVFEPMLSPYLTYPTEENILSCGSTQVESDITQ